MEVLAIIPVRGGSKGIPGKNIKPLAGKPLVYYTIQAANESKYVTRCVVSTEDAKIKKVVEDLGAEVVDRPMELAQDTTMTAPVLLQVVETLEKQDYKPDVVILLQATCPLRTGEDIDAAFELFLQGNCDSVFAGHCCGNTHALWREEKDGSCTALYDYHSRPRRQDVDRHYKLLAENGSIYIIKADVMKRVKDFVGDNPKIHIMPHCIDIDELSDFEKVEKILANRKSN